ncbi:MAG: DUF3696 domain-containing protein [Magnetococcales bacterium]|nr:DUF3696 domain-containing protein [Magnetococcales bacterium]
MLTHIHLTAFKCFEALSLPLAPLTLLTGFNAGGKSTALQGVLLPTQGMRSSNRTASLSLNGPLVQLGTPEDVLRAGHRDMGLSVEDEACRIRWTCKSGSRQNSSSMQITLVTIHEKGVMHEYNKPDFLDFLLPESVAKIHPSAWNLVNTLKETVFIGAIRSGIKDVFPFPDETEVIHADVGVEGQFAAWWFERFSDDLVDEGRLHPKERAPTLRRQFNAWASELFSNAQANVVPVSGVALTQLQMRISENGVWRRPANIGYGLTYAFPIIVAGLLAKPGQILVIDSPEAHLHPLGQSRMGNFLATLAASGVQVLVETHSDHILNGVCIAVKNGQVRPDDVALHFFQQSQNSDSSIPPVISPMVDRHGTLSEWPAGFFDQAEKDLAHLSGWG